MAVAINTTRLALDFIPRLQRKLDSGPDGRRFHVHRVSVYATILPRTSEIGRQAYSNLNIIEVSDASQLQRRTALVAKPEALDWQADPDDELVDAAVLHHLQQQAATVPILSRVISQNDHGNAATTLAGTALSASINATTQGRLLSSFHRHSYRLSRLDFLDPISCLRSIYRGCIITELFPDGAQDHPIIDSVQWTRDPFKFIVCAGSQRGNSFVFSQVQVDVVDLFSPRLPTPRPRKRRRIAFNQFRQLSHSSVGEDTFRRNPLPHAKRFNGVRHRTDRNIWVAEMKPPKHKTKQDFGNFKSEDEAARAVDTAFHHYGRPHLLNFPHTSLQFLSTRPMAPAGLDQKAKVKFVKEEAKLLLAATAASSPLHSTRANSLPIHKLSASPGRCPPGPLRSLSEISSPFRCRSPDEVDDVASQPQPWMLHDSICDISRTDLETLNSVRHAEQGWDWAEDSSALAAPLNPSTSESPSMWLDSILRSSPAPTYPRSPSPLHFQEEIAYALLEHQSI